MQELRETAMNNFVVSKGWFEVATCCFFMVYGCLAQERTTFVWC